MMPVRATLGRVSCCQSTLTFHFKRIFIYKASGFEEAAVGAKTGILCVPTQPKRDDDHSRSFSDEIKDE